MDFVTVIHFLDGFLMLALPILLGVYLVNRFRLSWKIWLIGGITFILSQALHIPFNLLVLNRILSNFPGGTGNIYVALLLGVSAGVFEGCARYGMFRWLLKGKHTWRTAILAGAGHGGVEAILLGVIVLWRFINLVVVRNADLTQFNIAPDQLSIARQQIQMYWSLPWYTSLLDAVERIFTIPFHILASVLVLQVFTRRPGRQQLSWLGLAILLHTLLDASAVFIAAKWGVYTAEAVLGALAIVDIVLIFALRQPEPAPSETHPPSTPITPLVYTPKPIEETSENLEKTRFQ
ncbi:MAG TPA: YhfC family glutamic-type intramembrane protease [Anaerolineales bacterium]|nr:YhfC family glutamic-type intramembrane protease [Anaerolineales bacterium]